MFNIFQGNDIIKNAIAKSLGYDTPQERAWFTNDMYFQAYFYLSRRFGNPKLFDEYKEAGAWSFNVKEYVIEIRMNSSWVEFMVYGRFSNRSVNSPYIVKYNRERLKNNHLVISEYGDWDKNETQLANTLFQSFLSENNIKKDSLTQEQFNENYGTKWVERICDYNRSIINIKHDDIFKLYGNAYQNSYTRHAIKTLNQFLKNMLTPIWIRDVPYNIKGNLSDDQAHDYERYCNNIPIEYKNDINI